MRACWSLSLTIATSSTPSSLVQFAGDTAAPSLKTDLPDHFTYDPMHPTPSYGGNVCCAANTIPGTGGIPCNMTARRTFSGGVRYKLPLPRQWGEVVANADEYYSSPTSFTGTTLPPYAVLNLRLDYNDINGAPVDVGVFVRNATNREYPQVPVASGAFLGMTSAIYGPPRMYGLEFRVRFGK